MLRVDWWMDFREGELRIALDEVIDGVEADEPQAFDACGPRDVVRALVTCGASEVDARAASRALWREGQQVARTHLEHYLVTVLEQPFPERYALSNQWTRVHGTELTRIAAGALADEPGQGIVIIARASAQVPFALIAKPAHWDSVDEARVPAACGRLRIDSAAGDVAGLVAADGSEWRLTVSTRRLSRFPGLSGH
jgi:hypothetical protein